MSGAGINQTSQIKSARRGRPADPVVAQRRRALYEIVKSMHPMTVRQVFYQATVRGLVEKAEHVGDYDPSGQDAARAIDATLRELAPEAEIHFIRLAVTLNQIEQWQLPTRPTKKTDTRAAKFGSDVSVELDA